ncbi:MAG: acetyl-CoA carboxylase carboxyltransferase subunit beta, partial [Dehalococcoidia bacterium]
MAHFLVYLLGKGRGDWRKAYLSPLHDRCLVCDQEIARTDLYQQYRVCPFCRFHYSLTARGRIELLADKGSFKEMYRSIVSLDPLSFSTRTSYRKRLSQDQKRTGLTEAAVVGRCSLGNAKAILVVLDFGFLGGSMGSVVGEKVALAFERAAKKSLPLVAVVSGGGVRIQEGILSLMQMAKTVTAATRLHRKGLPFIVVLTNPTTGQAYASFANLADVILAEPGSLMGLVPIRTLQEASQKPVPDDALTAEA